MSIKKVFIGVGVFCIGVFAGYGFVDQSLPAAFVSLGQTDTVLATVASAPVVTESDSATEEVVTTLGVPARALSISVLPSALIEDSRCPTEVACLQAGTVRVRASVITPTQMLERTFMLGVPVSVERFLITLHQVTPERVNERTVLNEAYQFTFTVAE